MSEPSSPLSLAEHIDTECDRYEAAFRARRNPRIEAFLEAVATTVRPALFRALLELDIELRKGQRETPVVSDYEQRFPEDRVTIQAIFEEAVRAASVVSSVKLTGVETSQGPRVQESFAKPSTGLPKNLGRFEIRSVLGEGAFGTVYRARDPQLDREVALKVPRFAGKQSREDRERFLREARAAAGLHHAHICPVHEVGTIDGRDYIVLSFIDGKPLSKLLQTQPKLSERQIAAVIRKLALALQEAHEKGIIHRDLKPANIMINRKGEPVIMDFGLARRDNAGDAQISQSGQIMGTPAYMSPEQARGDGKAVGPASDLYSLGVVLYELLCGRRPFEGTVTEVIGQILHVEPPQPSQFRAEVDPRLQAICMRAIAKKPSERFATMKEFATALMDFSRSTPGEVRSAPPAVESKKAIATNQFVDLLAAISSDVESKVERAVTKAGRTQRIPWWSYLVGSGLMGFIVLLGIFFFIRKDTVTVIVNIPIENIQDPALSFLLDDKPIAATAFAAPIELKPGKHELIVNKADKLFRRFVFDVGAKESDPVVVQDVTPVAPQSPPDDDFVALFNGKDLTGWDGDPRLWSVKDGVIHGETTSENVAQGNTCLIWKDGVLKDFDLRITFRCNATNNSGIQYRSKHNVDDTVRNKWVVHGYQYELRNELKFPNTSGFIYDEGGKRGRSCLVGEVATWEVDGKQVVKSGLISEEEFGKTFKFGDWNDVEIIARGNRVQHYLNGKLLLEFTDNHPALALSQGILALQLHAGEPMWVEFKNIRLRPIQPAAVEEGWVDLFNGKDFQGWNNPNKVTVIQGWVVKDGAIVRDKSNANDGPGGVWQRNNLWTQQRFQDFVLELEFRGTGTNTLVIRADQPNNDFSDRGLHVPMNLRGTPGNYWRLGTFYPFKSPSREPRIKDDWNQFRLTAVGPKITVDLNGETMNTIDLDRWVSQQPGKIDPDLPKILNHLSPDGHIGFNAREGEISLRNIRIKELGKQVVSVVTKVDDPDRKAAESLLALGGGFVKVNGQDRQIRQVSGLPSEPFRLTGAYFADVKALDDNRLAVLKDCVHLTELDLRSTRVTEKGLEIFRGKTNFTSLGLAYLRVSDTGLEIFKGNQGLRMLFLHDTYMTDKGLSVFHDCKQLDTVWVGGTPITDAGMLPFRDCKFLKWLDVRATKVTREGVQTIKAALPACRVDADPNKR